jgi:hypothetical protein
LYAPTTVLDRFFKAFPGLSHIGREKAWCVMVCKQDKQVFASEIDDNGINPSRVQGHQGHWYHGDSANLQAWCIDLNLWPLFLVKLGKSSAHIIFFW